MNKGLYRRYVKRGLDFCAALLALILLSPVMLALWLWIKLDSPGPALFQQKRVGADKRHFMIYKFRTMRTDTPRDMPTHMLEDPERFITRSGRFLRKSSLDELPQLLNILKGEMSLVGPRPALWNQADLIAERDRYGANALRPGLTGLAQISGRDELPIPQKARLDGEYVKICSLKSDLLILLKTAVGVVKMSGVVEGRQDGKAK